MTMAQAINNALRLEMERDERIIILGEDVGKNGGVFRITEGLWQKFGDERVVDTPLAESAIVGTSIGLALAGFVPISEIQFDGFLIPALDQLINHASRYRNRSRGRYSVHMVVRVPYGGGIKALEHHSDSPETYLCHTPGLKVVTPASPYEAKGLLISCIRDNDPIIFLEPKRLYRAIKEDVPEEEYTIPLGKARIVEEGSDVTLISYGSRVKDCMEVVERIKDEISVELIDLRTLSPLDEETIINSVKKTGRVTIVHEAPKFLGLASEISAIINEKALLSLEAPIERVTGWDVVIPLPKLENYYFPDDKRIEKAIRKVASF